LGAFFAVKFAVKEEKRKNFHKKPSKKGFAHLKKIFECAILYSAIFGALRFSVATVRLKT